MSALWLSKAHRSDKRHLRREAEIRPPLGTPAQHPGRSAS